MEKQINEKGLTELNIVELKETNGGSELTYLLFNLLGHMGRNTYDIQQTGINQIFLFS